MTEDQELRILKARNNVPEGILYLLEIPTNDAMRDAVVSDVDFSSISQAGVAKRIRQVAVATWLLQGRPRYKTVAELATACGVSIAAIRHDISEIKKAWSNMSAATYGAHLATLVMRLEGKYAQLDKLFTDSIRNMDNKESDVAYWDNTALDGLLNVIKLQASALGLLNKGTALQVNTSVDARSVNVSVDPKIANNIAALVMQQAKMVTDAND